MMVGLISSPRTTREQLPVLFHNLGGGLLDDATARTNAGSGCYLHVNWGCGFADLDNDGYKDLFIGNGHTEDNIELRMTGAVYHGHYVVLKNESREVRQCLGSVWRRPAAETGGQRYGGGRSGQRWRRRSGRAGLT